MENPLLLPVNQQYSKYDGAVEIKGKQFRFKVSLGEGNSLSGSNFYCEYGLQKLLKGNEMMIRQRLDQSKDIDSFLTELKVFLESIISEKAQDLLPPLPSYYGYVLNQLNFIGWNQIKYIDERLSRVELCVKDDNERIHDLIIQLPSDYPICICCLPMETKDKDKDLFKTNSFEEILSEVSCSYFTHYLLSSLSLITRYFKNLNTQFKLLLSQFQLFWNLLDDFDKHLIVLEPEKPSRSETRRRIIIEKHVTLQIQVNPISPSSIPTYLFLGSDNAISPLKVKFNSNINRWDKGRNLRENIQALLEMNLPSPNNNLTYDTLVSECAICYCYKLEDEIPNKICDNQYCGKIFHDSCITECFQRSSKNNSHSLFVIFGECPFCFHEMSVKIKDKY